MKLRTRPLNNGETFACSFKKGKALFKDTDVVLNFALYGRDYGTFSHTPDRYFIKHNLKGKVVAAMYMSPSKESPLLSFYVIKSSEYSEELKSEFDQKYLTEFYNFYHSVYNSKEIGLTHLMLVELHNNKLRVLKTSYR